jgi:hypothetical protein
VQTDMKEHLKARGHKEDTNIGGRLILKETLKI